MANTIKISDRMAEALTDSLATEDGQERRLAPWTRTGTCVALMDRGLLRYDRERTRGSGYEVHTLTPLGLAMREWLESRPELRSFDLDVLKCGAEVMSAEREEAPAATEPAPETSENNSVATQVTEYSVKIWYRSGAYQGAPHCPEELARKIFADAVESAGVEFAELHGPSGMLVESKTPNEERPVSTEPDENLFIAHLPQLPEPLPPAPELDYRDAACVAGDED